MSEGFIKQTTMQSHPEFTAPESAAEARRIQSALRDRLKTADDFGALSLIAGVDVGYDSAQDMAQASVVLMRRENLEVLEQAQAREKVTFPYISGLLAFREIPAITAALAKLTRTPDLLMVDGHGIAHPRRMGIAAHLGVLLDMPSIGVAKSRLTGRFTIPGKQKGEKSALMDGGERIGTVLRSRDNVQPLFISPGQRVSLETAVEITQQCLTKYRLPEPTRLADKLSKFR
jgi:deoxyribonuclease V